MLRRNPNALITEESITPVILEAALEIADGWYADVRVDWDDLLYRLESQLNIDLGIDTQSPAIKKIKAHVRSARRADGR